MEQAVFSRVGAKCPRLLEGGGMFTNTRQKTLLGVLLIKYHGNLDRTLDI